MFYPFLLMKAILVNHQWTWGKCPTPQFVIPHLTTLHMPVLSFIVLTALLFPQMSPLRVTDLAITYRFNNQNLLLFFQLIESRDPELDFVFGA